MMRRFPASRLAPIFAIGLLCVFIACTSPVRDGVSSAAKASSSSTAAGHDLSRDEDAGGHTLRKHVGRTDDQLRERLERERGISAASTYTDRATAERSVAAALEQARPRLERWLDRSGNRPNLVLDYDAPAAIGRTLHRGETASQPCSHAKAVLRWAGDREYYVLTSYPECR